MTTSTARPRWRATGYLPQVVGLFSVAFLVAVETFAVATALPVVAAELDGLSWYAVAFAAPAAAAIAAMTCAAWWCDRHGHAHPMVTGVSIFASGLVLSGVAGSMAWFVVGRAFQGIGAGLVSVALYVLVARAFPDHLRPRAFVVLTSAWVLPAVIGPLAAGMVAQHLGWRWVFLGVPAVAVGALALLRPALRSSHGDEAVAIPRTRIARSLVVAVAIFAVMIGGQGNVPGWWALVTAGIVLALVAAVPLLPAGTLRAARGLPAVIATRSLMGAGLVAAESWCPWPWCACATSPRPTPGCSSPRRLCSGSRARGHRTAGWHRPAASASVPRVSRWRSVRHSSSPSRGSRSPSSRSGGPSADWVWDLRCRR
ncbi:MFS transporter [Aeromicrobium sp. PE09-221]|uniref:MFS transporter n=1 Tax=Aeromicrobium sp. PE09-221 TaxID=1898043 RepID=UPI000B3E903F|nr:MFS transporter [Aeromicrobium sp. PE09-221]